MPRRKDEAGDTPVAVAEKPAPRPKAVTAIFHPDGNVRVNLAAPSGNEYSIVPRQPFQIAPEDVDWFFCEWDWRFRQRLTRVEDYEPPAGYFDASPSGAPKAPGSGEYFDATPGGTPKAPGSGKYLDTTPGTYPAPAAEYHDEGEMSTVITPEERETRDTEPAEAEAGADE